jgi:hypothetical protein
VAARLDLASLLLRKGLVDPAALARARRVEGPGLGAALVRQNLLAEDELLRVLAEQLRLPVARVRGKRVSRAALALVPAELAARYRCLPLLLRREGSGRVLAIACEDPSDREALDELAFQVGERLRPVLIGPLDLDDALARHYPPGAAAEAPAPAPAAESDTAPELPPRDSLLHPEPAARGAPEPGAGAATFSEDTAPELATAPAAAAAPPQDLLLRALAQLLLEKGVIGREELGERLQQLSGGEARARGSSGSA